VSLSTALADMLELCSVCDGIDACRTCRRPKPELDFRRGTSAERVACVGTGNVPAEDEAVRPISYKCITPLLSLVDEENNVSTSAAASRKWRLVDGCNVAVAEARPK